MQFPDLQEDSPKRQGYYHHGHLTQRMVVGRLCRIQRVWLNGFFGERQPKCDVWVAGMLMKVDLHQLYLVDHDEEKRLLQIDCQSTIQLKQGRTRAILQSHAKPFDVLASIVPQYNFAFFKDRFSNGDRVLSDLYFDFIGDMMIAEEPRFRMTSLAYLTSQFDNDLNNLKEYKGWPLYNGEWIVQEVYDVLPIPRDDHKGDDKKQTDLGNDNCGRKSASLPDKQKDCAGAEDVLLQREIISRHYPRNKLDGTVRLDPRRNFFVKYRKPKVSNSDSSQAATKAASRMSFSSAEVDDDYEEVVLLRVLRFRGDKSWFVERVRDKVRLQVKQQILFVHTYHSETKWGNEDDPFQVWWQEIQRMHGTSTDS